MPFSIDLTVRFAHVDGAAIVFYPRYFEMINQTLEDWLASMDFDFRLLHVTRRIGVPTVSLTSEFMAPSALGDRLTITVTPRRIGRTSCGIDYLISGDGRDRVKVSAVIVCMDLDRQVAVPWPEELRARIAEAISD